MTTDPKRALPPGFPLCWPEGWTRTKQSMRVASKYQVTEDRARRELEKGLASLGAARWVITTNKPLRLDGLPMASARSPDDPGVSVWWVDNAEAARARAHGGTPAQKVIACDQWETTRENMRAIGLTIEALRAIQRSGATQILDRAVAAFKVPALPAGRPWWAVVLDIDVPTTEEEISRAFKKQAKVCHPDQGGTFEKWRELELATKTARESLQTERRHYG